MYGYLKMVTVWQWFGVKIVCTIFIKFIELKISGKKVVRIKRIS